MITVTRYARLWLLMGALCISGHVLPAGLEHIIYKIVEGKAVAPTEEEHAQAYKILMTYQLRTWQMQSLRCTNFSSIIQI